MYIYSSKNSNTTLRQKIIMSKWFDPGTTFPDPHSKIPPDSHISTSKAIVWTRFQPKKKNLIKLYAWIRSLWTLNISSPFPFCLTKVHWGVCKYIYIFTFVSLLFWFLTKINWRICTYIYIYKEKKNIYIYIYIYS